MNAFTLTDFQRLKWLLGQMLSLIAFWAMLDLDFGNQPLLLLFSGVVVVTVFLPGLPGRIGPLFWRAMTPALVLIVVLDFMLHGADFMKPLVRMVMLLTVYRALQYRSRREDMQLVLLCLFILVISGVLTVSLSFGVQMLLFTPLAMILLFVINLLEGSNSKKLTRADWKRFGWLSFLWRLRQSMDYRLLGFAAVLFAGVVTVSSLIFVTIPRFRIEQALPFLQMPGTSMTGFSDIVRYGDVSRLQNDERIALRVEVPNANKIPSTPYWRMVVLDEYTEQGFRMSHGIKRRNDNVDESKSVIARHWGREPDPQSRREKWNIFMEGNVSEYLPLLGPFDQLRFQKRSKFYIYPWLNLVALTSVDSSRMAYSVRGMDTGDRIAATGEEVRALRAHQPLASLRMAEDPLELMQYPGTTRALPWRPEDREYLQSVVEEITEGERLPPELFIQKALQWLHSNYKYSRSLQEMYMVDGDPLIMWMQQDNGGWCEHFAGAFALLARAAGYPSRMVAGFAGAEWNGYENYLVVRNSNAHAWVEMYDLEGNWLRVDPTPQSGIGGGGEDLLRRTATVGTFSGWLAWIDSVRMIWYRRVINFDERDQADMAGSLKSYSKQTYGKVQAWLKSRLAEFKAWLTQGWDRKKSIMIGLTVAGACFLFLGLRYLVLWLRALAVRRGSLLGFQATNPARKRAGALLARFRPAHQQVTAQGLSPDEAQLWKDTYQELLRVRFGDLNIEQPNVKLVFRRTRRLLRQARRRGWQ